MKDILIITAGNWVGWFGLAFAGLAIVTFLYFIYQLIQDLRKKKK